MKTIFKVPPWFRTWRGELAGRLLISVWLFLLLCFFYQFVRAGLPWY